MPSSEKLPDTFRVIDYVAEIHHLDLDRFLEEKCGRSYDSSGGLDFPSTGTMYEINTGLTYLDDDEHRLGKEWLSGMDVPSPSLVILFDLLSERGDIPEGNYLIAVCY